MRKRWLVLVLAVVLAVVLVAVSWSPIQTYLSSMTQTIEGQIEDVREDSLLVDCSDEATRGIGGDMNDVGYICEVRITEDTTIYAVSGAPVQLEALNRGTTVQVLLTKQASIRSIMIDGKERTLIAQEVTARE